MTIDEFLHYTSIALIFLGLLLIVGVIYELIKDNRGIDNDVQKIMAFELIGHSLIIIATLIGGILLYWATK